MSSPTATRDSARLERCLNDAASGDQRAFATFYDLTVDSAWALAQAATWETQRDPEAALRQAYARAWAMSPLWATSTVQRPLPWLLTLVRESCRPAA
ncbi:hypothetical protein [Nocardioides sp. R-C-SC26]|uniref:hypothetical protein n=1 Tax=Nocardioides sp. R-C-SC26 TaxID=2870414 RepID=UPI001E47F58F|nr:hypothetical protein [Nocardioides sp. R-C-SC26]